MRKLEAVEGHLQQGQPVVYNEEIYRTSPRIVAHVRAPPLHQLANRGGDGDRISICSHNARSDCRSHHPALAAIGLLVRWGVWDTGTRGTPSATLARTHHLSSPIVMGNAAVPDVCLLYGGPLACADNPYSHLCIRRHASTPQCSLSASSATST